MISIDPKIKNLLEVAETVAASKASILIQGESGTGKEVLAKYIHSKSQRSSQRMVAVNCAALPEGLLESELFGYLKGAFTGANTDKAGKFELAHNSTLLLDEVTEMPLSLQAKLLRVLQEGEVERLGARQPLKINVRIICTTNRSMDTLVKEGKFREDLYYRLNVIPLVVPPLRARTKDIEVLAKHFLEVSCILNNKEKKVIAPEAIEKLLNYSWPGNVRELENTIERSVLLSSGSILRINDISLPEEISIEDKLEPGMTVSEIEKKLILKTLQYTNQNRTHAAKLLGISIRTLRNKLNEYNHEVQI